MTTKLPDGIRIPSIVIDRVSPRALDMLQKVKDFVENEAIPADEIFEDQLPQDADTRWTVTPSVLDDLKLKAHKAGLWNLWLSEHYEGGAGFTNLEYGLMCEQLGRSGVASEAMNCSAPDTGNMEVLAKYGTKAQKDKWLQPLLDGKIRSAYVMTDKNVASSDAKNIALEIKPAGDHYILNGLKWWISGAGDPRCKLYVVFGVSNPDSPNPNKRNSIILVDSNTPGITVKRALKVYGFDDAPHGHCEVEFKDVKVAASNIILGEGRGFEVMQGRMGPGRIHHCMRAIGAAEKALEYMIARVHTRFPFGKALAEQGVIQDWIARSRLEIDAGRLIVLNAADMIDRGDAKTALAEIGMAKIYVPTMACTVVDRAIQAHGGGGISQEFPLARSWTYLRTTRLVDGPDEVHVAQLAKMENRRHKALIAKIDTQNKKHAQLQAQYGIKVRTKL